MKMDGLPDNAKKAYKFKNMQETLVSIPVIYGNGCEVTSTKQNVQVSEGGRTILTGYREPATKLWRFPNAPKPQPSMQKQEPQINTVIPDGTMKETLTFLHRSMGSPTTRTLLKAIRKINLSTWPFITEINVCKLLPHSTPIALGHQDITSKNAQSTTPHPTTDDQKQELKTIDIYTKINQPETPPGKIHSDKTGIFPIQSISRKKYMMVIYAYDPNAILVEPLRDRTKESILQV